MHWPQRVSVNIIYPPKASLSFLKLFCLPPVSFYLCLSPAVLSYTFPSLSMMNSSPHICFPSRSCVLCAMCDALTPQPLIMRSWLNSPGQSIPQTPSCLFWLLSPAQWWYCTSCCLMMFSQHQSSDGLHFASMHGCLFVWFVIGFFLTSLTICS